MEEEIVLKTEVVKVSELQGREKQIYEYGYSKGFKEGLITKENDRWKVFRIGVTALVITVLSYFLTRF